MTKTKKKKKNIARKPATVRKPAAKAKTKSAPKKVSKPLVKAKSKTRPVAAKAAPAKAKAKPVAVRATAKPVTKPVAKPAAPKAAVAAKPQAAQPQRVAPLPAPVAKPLMTGPVVATPASKKLAFKIGDLVVYPAHGVGKVTLIEEQEIAGATLELYIVDFEKEKLRLKVPTGRAEQKGMRRLSDKAQIEQALRVLKGRARIKRTMWSRRAQEYEAKINSGDLISIAEVVRDLYRSEAQPEQSYSERQLYEAALDRMAREIAAVEKLDEVSAVAKIDDVLAKTARHAKIAAEAEARTRAA